MAKNVTVAWDLPTTRTGGGVLLADEIDHVHVELSADDGANYGTLNRVTPADPQQVFIPDMEVGVWKFRLTVVDTLGQTSAPHVEVVEVKDDSPPNPISGVTVTQE